MNSKTSYLRTTINISTQSLNYTLYIPLTDILFTSVFIEENSFTAFMTCVTMIFLPTDATSFSSNNNVTKQHQCNYATDNAHTHTHSFVLAPECQCPNSRQCDCLNNELPKDTTDQGLNWHCTAGMDSSSCSGTTKFWSRLLHDVHVFGTILQKTCETVKLQIYFVVKWKHICSNVPLTLRLLTHVPPLSSTLLQTVFDWLIDCESQTITGPGSLGLIILHNIWHILESQKTYGGRIMQCFDSIITHVRQALSSTTMELLSLYQQLP